MRSSRKNENAILSYIQERLNAPLNQLEENFVRDPITKQMSKDALYRSLKRLCEKHHIRRIEVPKGKRKKVYYELITFETIIQVKKYINDYKKKNNNNPSLEEIAIEIGKTPEEIKHAVYAVAKDLEWYNPENLKENQKTHFFKTFSDDLNKTEIKLILQMLNNKETRKTAINYLSIISSKQQLIEYPKFLEIINKILNEINTEEELSALLNMIYFIITSPKFRDRIEEEEVKREYDILTEKLVSIIHSSSNEQIKGDSLRILGMQKDKRVIEILISSLKETKGEEFPFKNIFYQWIFSSFYKEYKLKLIEEMSTLAKENKKGADILSSLINRDREF